MLLVWAAPTNVARCLSPASGVSHFASINCAVFIHLFRLNPELLSRWGSQLKSPPTIASAPSLRHSWSAAWSSDPYCCLASRADDACSCPAARLRRDPLATVYP